ncbi:MAG: phycobilisome rod-core linker polypeptide [Cyanobacteria bacterium]|nr:phycobilisome rod-core linker polypeptide [Cyanobacteriota bacterium]MDA0865576.1 phycobilisome rod-core linker polypeptide [Cyanobacteriota bacterium]
MALSQLEYTPTSQNQRVNNFHVPGDDQPVLFTTNNQPDSGEAKEIVRAAYRQIFNEQQMLASNRLTVLESQLNCGQITVRDFIRGLLVSPVFRERNYDPNSNYRFARMCLQRVLGREAYNDREVLALSITLATRGLNGFVDDLLNSDEYLANFGEDTVPYQRNRILPQHGSGDVTFAHMPRYGADYRDKLKDLGYDFQRTGSPSLAARWDWQKPPYPQGVQILGKVIALGGGTFFGLIAIATILSWFGLLHI